MKWKLVSSAYCVDEYTDCQFAVLENISVSMIDKILSLKDRLDELGVNAFVIDYAGLVNFYKFTNQLPGEYDYGDDVNFISKDLRLEEYDEVDDPARHIRFIVNEYNLIIEGFGKYSGVLYDVGFSYDRLKELRSKLVNINKLKITFSIPEKYAGTVKMNTKISFTVAGSKNVSSATVYAIEPGINVATRTLQLKAKASNPNGELMPGSFAKIELPLTNTNDAILVPTQSVIPVLMGKKVFISSNGKAKEVMVETDTRTDKSVLISSGLSVGDTVLTTGIMSLKNDTPIEVKVINE
jgi:multidrug efflux pump subunit AcrA (membrane-fusion protein)